MNNIYLGFKFAFSYFSILPVRFKKEDDLSKKEILNCMILFFPIVGLIIGILISFLHSFLDSIPWLAAIISSCLYMIFYGFLHTEAILDIVDAIYAKHSGKDAYKVIKEPTIGAMGLLYSLAFVIIKISAFSFLFLNDLIFEFISILIISRISIQFMISFYDFKSSFVSTLKNSFNRKTFFIFAFLLFIFISIIIGFKSIFLFIFAFILAVLLAKFIKKNVGFLNGDALGFSLEFIEILLALGVCYLWL